MNDLAKSVSYWCEAFAEGLVYGQGIEVRYVLGTFQTISPVLALRWLIGEARHIADRLDPDPQRSAWVQSFMQRPAVPASGCPTELRLWCGDRWEQRVAREQIKGGDPLFVVVPDVDCRYTLSVWPVRVPTSNSARPRSYEPSADYAHGLAPSPSTTRAGYSCCAGAPLP